MHFLASSGTDKILAYLLALAFSTHLGVDHGLEPGRAQGTVGEVLGLGDNHRVLWNLVVVLWFFYGVLSTTSTCSCQREHRSTEVNRGQDRSTQV